MRRTFLFRSAVASQTLTNARDAAGKLLNAEQPVFAPQVLSAIDFSPSRITEQNGTLVFPFQGTGAIGNAFQSLHGGALATLGDVFTSLALWGVDPQSRHVSVSFDIQFFGAAKVGNSFECATRITRKGKRLAFTEFEFRDSRSGEIVCKGSHVKAFV